MKSVFDTFSADDLLRGNKWRGQELPPETLAALNEQAKQLSESTLWKILKAELQWFAIKSLMEAGKDEQDIRIARIFGNVVQTIDAKLKDMSK